MSLFLQFDMKTKLKLQFNLMEPKPIMELHTF